jgi:hypothetical protein
MSSGGAEPVVPVEFNQLATLVHTKPESFATGDDDIRMAALTAAKHAFDTGASTMHVIIQYC